MSIDGDYDPDNIFAKVVRGEAPAAKVFEDAEILAFLDLFPQSRGHTLVISKTSTARNILDVDPGDLCVLMTGVQRVAKAVRAALQPDGLIVTQFNGAPACAHHPALGEHADGGSRRGAYGRYGGVGDAR
jgi:histidine triad (HIT) family protein